MKTLYLIGGTMGVGKSAACRALKSRLNNAVFLDGDWCWDMHPFVVNAETKAMVLGNITHLLNNFLACSQFEHVIFCWVMHEQPILDELCARLNTDHCRIVSVSLVCSEEVLCRRLTADIAAGLRSPDILERSISRLGLYAVLNTRKLDTSVLTPEQTAAAISEL